MAYIRDSGYSGKKPPKPSGGNAINTAQKIQQELAKKNAANNAANKNNSGYGGGSSSSGYKPSNPAQDAYSESEYDRYFRQQQSAAERQREAAERAAAQERRARQQAADENAQRRLADLARSTAGMNTEEHIRNAYALRDMPQQNALMGNGGLSETSLMNANAVNQNNMNRINLEKLAYENQIEGDRSAGILGADTDYYSSIRDANTGYEQKVYEMENERAKLAAKLAYGGGSGGGSSGGNSKPRLSYPQYLDAVKNGYGGPIIDEAAAYYGNINIPKAQQGGVGAYGQGGGSNVQSDINASRNPNYNPTYTTANKEAVIRQALESGLPQSEVLAQLSKAGVTQADLTAYQNKYGYNRYTGAR